MRSPLVRMLLLCWMFALPLVVHAQELPPLDATLTIPEASFSMDYPGDWDLAEDELTGYSLSSDDFAVVAIIAYVSPEELAELGGDLESAHDSLQDAGLVDSDPEPLEIDGQDALRSAGDSEALGSYTVNLLVEAPTDGAVFIIAVIFSDIERNERILDAIYATIRFGEGESSTPPDDPAEPVVRDADIPALDATLDVPELGFSLRYPADWAMAEYDGFVYVVGENESDLELFDPAGLRATLIYVEDYSGDNAELISQFLGSDFYYSTRIAEVINVGGSPSERLRGVTGTNATYRTMTLIELPAGDAYALIVDGAVRDKFSIVALSDAMLGSVEIRDSRTESPDDDQPEDTATAYDLAQTFELPEAGFRMAYPEGWILEEVSGGVYVIAPDRETIDTSTLDNPLLIVLHAPPTDYEGFGGTLEDFSSLLFGIIDARATEALSVDGRDALRVSGPLVNREAQGYAIGVVFNGGDGGGLLVIGAIGEDRADELDTLFAALLDTMEVTDEGL